MDFKNSAALNVLHKYRRSQNGELEGAATLFCLVQTEFLALIDESKVHLQFLPTSLIQ